MLDSVQKGVIVRQISHAWRRARTNASWWAAILLLAATGAVSIAVGLAYRTIVLNPFPGTRANEVVTLGGLAHGTGFTDPVEWWGQAPGLDFISIYRVGDAHVSCAGLAKWLRVAEVSSGFFDIFDDVILTGRRLLPDDEVGDPRVIVISQDLFLQLKGTVGVLECRIGPHNLRLVGTTDSRLRFPSGAQAWIPRVKSAVSRPPLVEGAPGLPPVRSQTGWIALPKRGVGLDRLKVEMRQLLEAANTTLTPKTGVRYGQMVSGVLLSESLTAAVRPGLFVLFLSTLVAFTLCLGNVGIFAMESFQARQRDFAVHVCLGAPKRHQRNVIFAEAVLLAAVVVAGTLALSSFCLHLAEGYLAEFRTFIFLASDSFPLWIGVALLLFALVVVTVVLAGLVASRKLSLVGRAEGRLVPSSDGRAVKVARRLFVGLASLVATVLLGGTLVALSAMRELLNVDLGYSPDGVASVRLVIQRSMIDGARYRHRRAEIADLARAAGLARVSLVNALPIKANERGFVFLGSDERKIMAAISLVDAAFFDVIGLALNGPGFSDSEYEVVINSSAAKSLFPEGAVGKTVTFDGDPQPMRVVGIAPDLRTVDQTSNPVLQVYRRHAAIDGSIDPTGAVQVQLLGACGQGCMRTLDNLVQALSSMAGVTVLRAEPLQAAIDAARGNSVVVATLWSIYGALAIGVAVLTMMSMARQSAYRARREVGLRMALGAGRRRIVAQLTKEPLISGALGACAGVIGTSLAVRGLTSTVGPIALPSLIDLMLAAGFLVAVAAFATVATTTRTIVTPPSVLLRANESE